jgi:hypothetical protein
VGGRLPFVSPVLGSEVSLGAGVESGTHLYTLLVLLVVTGVMLYCGGYMGLSPASNQLLLIMVVFVLSILLLLWRGSWLWLLLG